MVTENTGRILWTWKADERNGRKTNAAKVLVWHSRAERRKHYSGVDECWLKKCKYCNRYILHGVGCSVDISKRAAMKLKNDIYRELGELRFVRWRND